MNALLNFALRNFGTSTLISMVTLSLTLYKLFAPATRRAESATATTTSIKSRLFAFRKQGRGGKSSSSSSSARLSRPTHPQLRLQFDRLEEVRERLATLDSWCAHLQCKLLSVDAYFAQLRPLLDRFYATGTVQARLREKSFPKKQNEKTKIIDRLKWTQSP